MASRKPSTRGVASCPGSHVNLALAVTTTFLLASILTYSIHLSNRSWSSSFGPTLGLPQPATSAEGIPRFCGDLGIALVKSKAAWHPSMDVFRRSKAFATGGASPEVQAAIKAVHKASQVPLELGKQVWHSKTPGLIRLHLKTSVILGDAGTYPTSSYNGRGIVIVAGGKRYSPPAYACITFLRRTGCQLPVEVWTPPHEPLPKVVAHQFESLGAVVRNLGDVFPSETHNALKGYASKPAAILASSFAEVLLLDADNIPLRDPGFLFEHELYSSHGLLMWPDFWPCEAEAAAWDALNLSPDVMPRGSHESGQLLVDKRRGWQPLLLSLFLNWQGDVFYPLLSDWGQGDKETFAFAWLSVLQSRDTLLERAGANQSSNIAANISINAYGRVTYPVMAVGEWEASTGKHKGYAMLQRSPNGIPLFLHVHLPKIDLQVSALFQRRWLNLTYGTNGDKAIVPPEASPADPKTFDVVVAAAGYDVEFEVHKFRQQLRCDSHWGECCL